MSKSEYTVKDQKPVGYKLHFSLLAKLSFAVLAITEMVMGNDVSMTHTRCVFNSGLVAGQET